MSIVALGRLPKVMRTSICQQQMEESGKQGGSVTFRHGEVSPTPQHKCQGPSKDAPRPPTPDGSDFSLSYYNHRNVPLDSSYGNFHCLYWIFSYRKCSILLFLDYMYFRTESVFISCTACSFVHSVHKQI